MRETVYRMKQAYLITKAPINWGCALAVAHPFLCEASVFNRAQPILMQVARRVL